MMNKSDDTKAISARSWFEKAARTPMVTAFLAAASGIYAVNTGDDQSVFFAMIPGGLTGAFVALTVDNSINEIVNRLSGPKNN